MSADADQRASPDVAGLSQLLGMPLFAGISATSRARLTEATSFREVRAGETIIIEEDPTADAYYGLLEGEVAITRDDRMLGLLAAPAHLGMLSLLDGAARSATITAFTDIRVAVISDAVFDELIAADHRFARNVLDDLVRDLRSQQRREGLVRARFDDMFDSPNARLIPGPWEMKGSELHVFVVVGPTLSAQRHVAPGVRPLGAGLGPWLLCFLTHPDVQPRSRPDTERSLQYREALPLIVADVEGLGPALYCPEAYPDNYLAIFVGRELYGMPRRIGDIRRAPKSFDLGVDQRLLLRASWRSSRAASQSEFVAALHAALTAAAPAPPLADGEALQAALTAIDTWLSAEGELLLPIVVRRQVPDVLASDGDLLRIDDLQRVDVTLAAPRGLRLLQGTSLRRFERDWLLGGRCTGGFRLLFDAAFVDETRLRSLLPEADA